MQSGKTGEQCEPRLTTGLGLLRVIRMRSTLGKKDFGLHLAPKFFFHRIRDDLFYYQFVSPLSDIHSRQSVFGQWAGHVSGNGVQKILDHRGIVWHRQLSRGCNNGRFLPFLPPRSASFRPQRLRSQSTPNGPHLAGLFSLVLLEMRSDTEIARAFDR